MNDRQMHWVNRLAALGLAMGLTAGLAGPGVAQSVAGLAYATYVNTPVASSARSALAVLPAISGNDGAEADAQGGALAVPTVLWCDFLNGITSGELGADQSGAQSTASAADISILNGLVTADRVIANVTSRINAGQAVSSADGSTFQNLKVAGLSVTSGDASLAPNTNIALAGVGNVVLNEQITTGDGVTSSGLTVNMIHVYLRSLTATGEIIVGSATSSVGL